MSAEAVPDAELIERHPGAGGELLPCPECNGDGWVVGTDTRCCGNSEYECGGRGCTGPEPEQVQEQCERCFGTGTNSTDTAGAEE